MTAIFRIFRPRLITYNLFKMLHIVDHSFYAQQNNYLRIVTGREKDGFDERKESREKMQQSKMLPR